MVEVKYTCSVCGSQFDSEEALANDMTTNHATQDTIYEEEEEKE